jgi:hypothetical protein
MAHYGLLLVALTACSGLTLSCSKSDQGVPAAPQQVQKQVVEGTLKVRIMPESPLSTQDLQASLSGGGVSFAWENGGAPIANETGSRLSHGHFAKGNRVTVIASRGGEQGRVTVVIGNAPPRISSVSFAPEEIYRGVDITAQPAATDPDGDEVRFDYKWSVNGAALPENSAVLKGDRFKRGDRVFLVVTPSDGVDPGPSFKTQEVSIPNAPPHFVSTPPLEFSSATYGYRAQAVDADGDQLSYSLAGSSPRGMSIDTHSGMVSWPLASTEAGSYPVEIVVSDAQGGERVQRYSLTIRPNGGKGR